MAPPIILFTYDHSVNGRKVDFVFALNGLDYAHCMVLNRLPRPVLEKLGVQYRRIPILAIGRDIYCDTKLIINKLEEHFPEKSIGSKDPFEKGLEHLFETWLIDAGPFWRTSALLPPAAKQMQDKEWLQDRTNMTGRPFDPEMIKKLRPESLSHVRMYFDLMEKEFLADGREYLLNTKEPALVDVQGIWTFEWILGDVSRMFEFLEKDAISAEQFPKTFAWVRRFQEFVTKKREQNGGAVKELSAEGTIEQILASDFFEPEGTIDPRDPLKLNRGQLVDISPIESGFTHHDKGELVSIGVREVVIAIKPNVGSGYLRLHFPRVNYRIQPVEGSKE